MLARTQALNAKIDFLKTQEQKSFTHFLSLARLIDTLTALENGEDSEAALLTNIKRETDPQIPAFSSFMQAAETACLRNDADQALTHYQKAMACLPDLTLKTEEEQRYVGLCHVNFARFLLSEAKKGWLSHSVYDRAYSQYEAAINLFGWLQRVKPNNEINLAIAYCYAEMADIHAWNESWDGYLDVIELALAHFNKITSLNIMADPEMLSYLQNFSFRIAKIKVRLYDLADAIKHFQAAVDYGRAIPNPNDTQKRAAAEIYFQMSLVNKRLFKMEAARELMLNAAQKFGQISQLSKEDFTFLANVYRELSDLCSLHQPEHMLFNFATNVLSANLWRNVHWLDLEKLLYVFSVSENWQTSRVQKVLVSVLEIIAATHHSAFFPASNFHADLAEPYRYLEFQTMIEKVKLGQFNSSSAILADLTARLDRLEVENKQLRTKLEVNQHPPLVKQEELPAVKSQRQASARSGLELFSPRPRRSSRQPVYPLKHT